MLDTFLIIACLVGLPICYGVMRYCENNVKLTYKEQRIGVKK